MQLNPAPSPSPFPSAPTAVRSLQHASALNRLNFALLAILIAAICFYLAPQWRHNPDLAHGWLTPAAFLLLLHETRRAPLIRTLLPGFWSTFLVAGLGVAGLAFLGLGGLYMAALNWSHALVASLFTAALCAFLASAWVLYAGRTQSYLPFNWTVGVAISLWILSAPLPPGTYGALTHALQEFVTATVLRLLHIGGIAAVRHGNVIQLPHVSVGVEEACSGVRSLLTCIYAGFFVSAAWLKKPVHRLLILSLAPLLAVATNTARSFTLTLLAWRGVDITGAWHDLTGYAVVAVAAATLAYVASKLQKPDVSKISRQEPAPESPALTGSPWPDGILTATLVLAVGLCGFYLAASNTRRSEGHSAPDLTKLLPDRFPGWIVRPNSDLYRFAPELQTTFLTQTTYYRENDPAGCEVTVYLAYWPAGQVPVSLVASHTPDACWPGTGWSASRAAPPRIALKIEGHSLDTAEYRIFTQNEQIQHVWYWHLYGGRVIHPDAVRSPRHLLWLAWTYGFRQAGDQMFVRVSSNRTWEEIDEERLLQEIFTRLTPFGL